MVQRREVLHGGIALITAGIAGCSSDNETGDDEWEPESETESELTSTSGQESNVAVGENKAVREQPNGGTTAAKFEIEVVSATGRIDQGKIKEVVLTIKKDAPISIDARGITVEWFAPSGTYTVAASSSATDTADGYFEITAETDGNSSAPVLDSAADRFNLVFTLGDPIDDSKQAASGETPSLFGEPLDPETILNLDITLPTKRSVNHRYWIPQLGLGKNSVELQPVEKQ